MGATLRTARILQWLVSGAILSASACVNGIDPPEVTPLVEVRTGLTFRFGSSLLCGSGGQNTTANVCQGIAPIGPEDPVRLVGIQKMYPQVLLTLSSFAIDAYEVTNFQYEYCVARGACKDPAYDNTASIENYYANKLFRDRPVVNVTQDMAQSYCAFVGRRLPTAAEWERVAAGPSLAADESDKYWMPMKNGTLTMDACKRNGAVNVDICSARREPLPVGTAVDDWVEITTDGPRVYDLGGNVSEWVAGFHQEDVTCATALPEWCDSFLCGSDTDCIASSYNCAECVEPDCFRMCPAPEPPQNFPGLAICNHYTDEARPASSVLPTAGGERPYRGGHYMDGESNACFMRGVSERHLGPSESSPILGFRCAADII